MSLSRALASGFLGAVALNLLHETARRLLPNAPRVDLLGERATTRLLKNRNVEPPTGDNLYVVTLAGDVVSNGLYFSLVGVGKPQHAPRTGALLGLTAGLGAVLLPGPLGLGKAPSARTPATAVMTVGWYLVGGLVAGLAYRRLAQRHPNPSRVLPDGREWNF